MTQISSEIRISAPKQKVWGIIADLWSCTEFSPCRAKVILQLGESCHSVALLRRRAARPRRGYGDRLRRAGASPRGARRPGQGRRQRHAHRRRIRSRRTGRENGH